MDDKTFHIDRSNPAKPLNATAASLLGFLLEEPRTGWDLVAAVESSIGYFWNLTRSQVYRELRSLADSGLVEELESGPRDRRPYAITEAGRRAFDDWLHRDPGNDLVRMQALLKFFFGDQMEPETIERFVTLERLKHEKNLAYFKEILPEVEAHAPMCAHTLRFGIRFEELILEWLQETPVGRKVAAAGEPTS